MFWNKKIILELFLILTISVISPEMSTQKSEDKKFKFWFPATISKAQGPKGTKRMVLGGIASTAHTDSDGENLIGSGFDINPLKEYGLVNWHHGAKTNPETIIGEPSVAEMRKGGLYIEADLYKDSSMANNVYKLAEVLEKNSKTRRLGFSVEGKVLERDPLNSKRIIKAAITGVAITHMPKNIHTLAEIIKGEVDLDETWSDEEKEEKQLSLEEINKALESELLEAKCALADQLIKGDVNDDEEETEKSLATNTPSGKALMPAHVDGDTKDQTSGSKLTESEKIKKAKIYDKIFSTFSDIDISKAKKLYLIIQKTSEMKVAKNPTDEDIQKAAEILGIELAEEEVNKAENDELEEQDDIIDKGEENDEDLEKGEMKVTVDHEDDDDEEEVKKGDMPVNKDPKENAGDGKTKKESVKENGDNMPIKKSGYMKKGDNYVAMGLNAVGELVEVDDTQYIKKGEDFVPLGEAEVTRNELRKAISEEFGEVKGKQDEISKAIGSVLLRFNEENEDFKKAIDERLSAIENATPGRKSFAKPPQGAERTFEKSSEEDISKGLSGEDDPNTISVSRNRGLVSNILEKAMYLPLEKGISEEIDPVFEKALTTFEASGEVKADAIKKLRTELGINLVR